MCGEKGLDADGVSLFLVELSEAKSGKEAMCCSYIYRHNQ